jgi:hypothetical protein
VVAELMVIWRWDNALQKQALTVDTGNVTSCWLLSNIYVAPGKLQVINDREMKQVCLGHTWIKVNVEVQMHVVACGHHAQMIDTRAEISGR